LDFPTSNNKTRQLNATFIWKWQTKASCSESVAHFTIKRSVIMLSRIAAAPKKPINCQQEQLIAISMGLRALWLVKKNLLKRKLYKYKYVKNIPWQVLDKKLQSHSTLLHKYHA
jgi:hypothetical protein